MIKNFLSILMYLLLINIAYGATSKLEREKLEHPGQFIIKWLLIIIALGELTRYILTHT